MQTLVGTADPLDVPIRSDFNLTRTVIRPFSSRALEIGLIVARLMFPDTAAAWYAHDHTRTPPEPPPPLAVGCAGLQNVT